MKTRWLKLIGIVVTVLIIDQVTKRAVMNALFIGETVDLIPFLSPFFRVTYSLNTGAAFGFLPQAGDLFLIIAIVVVIGVLIFYPRIPESQWLTRLGIALVCGGALGNAIDRLDHGAVIDFIHYTVPGLISNVSNLADHAIVIGVLIMLFDTWRSEDTDAQNKATPEPPSTETPV